MMGVSHRVLVYIFGDNQSVLYNRSTPDYTPKENPQITAYSIVLEGAARYKWRTVYVIMHDNEAYLLTE